ncbi:diguanylate cyclase with Chase2 sensor [[Leptolyngbya] sp. PCC 7376]|uniref:CHASE2 domain-containing protein n=1 Tax=[Leptolyngbya] sp. PCC 7376 TaxID=111781 RepID=UPI00029EDE79|nr:CHASE2 domain-containing protein [[Leptolyngbya] sp. PCC 7376]AFY39732.1 diguanylate cyclase with Chase2 sensor [[Leptolyngbya] sp. PCC 7376]
MKRPSLEKFQKFRLLPWYQHCANATLSAAIAIGLSFTGGFQLVEWAFFDQTIRMRPKEQPDPNIVVVTFDEVDLEKVGTWPIPDDTLATILDRVTAYEPRVIGLDLYRNLPVGNDGYEALVQAFSSNTNLYGVSQQVEGETTGAPEILKKYDRVRLADLILDVDSKVRRALLSIRDPEGEIKLALGTQLALNFLEAEGIEPEVLDGESIQLGNARLFPLHGTEGGYVRMDGGGYQILLNYRGIEADFHTISITDILEERMPEELIRDRIVIIGATASTLNDFFQTPYNGSLSSTSISPVPGVIIHANITSQLVSAALGDRALIRTLPDYVEWLWAFVWAMLGTAITAWSLNNSQRLFGGNRDKLNIFIGFVLLESALLAIATTSMLLNVWIPIMPASLGLGLAIFSSLLLSNRQLHGLATLDELTKVANRRSFDTQLSQAIADPDSNCSLILCDIDNFKLYNDTYGHQAGDTCLYRVAQKMRETVRQRDIVARYGGEEFAIILKGTSLELAEEIAQRICKQIFSLNIPHDTSSNSAKVVTMSCGVSIRRTTQKMTTTELIQMADQALYLSKKQGRNRVTLYKKMSNQLPDSLNS